MMFPKIDRYEIKKMLSQGAMGTICIAYDPQFKRSVAIKVSPHDVIRRQQVQHSFNRVFKLFSNLKHEAIVPIYDVGSDKDQSFIVMRYMEGGSLSERLEKEALSLDKVVPIIQRIASALDYIHEKEIFHNDLKPSNILFDELDQAYISDFENVALASEREGVDKHSDIYMLGTLLLEMLTRQTFRFGKDQIPNILESNPNLPVGIISIIKKALSKEPGEWYQTASEMANALYDLLHFKKTFDVYVSYNSHDRPDLAIEIIGALEAKKLNVWYDEKYLRADEDWKEISRKALEKTSVMLVLIGAVGLGVGQQEELTLALSFPNVVFIPILLPGTTLDVLPEFLNYQDWIDFREGLNNKSAFKHLISTIKGTVGEVEGSSANAEGSNSTAVEKISIINGGTVGPSMNISGGLVGSEKNVFYDNIIATPSRAEVYPSQSRRVLNANFSYSPQQQLLKPRNGLVAGEDCCLLVDIGLPWKRGKSITQGKIDLTETLSGEDDYVIQAVFVSDDFEPKMISAEIYVSADSNRSFPLIHGEISKEPSPAALWMKAPQFPKGFDSSYFMVHGRLCLYYKNYLLQSAVVSVGIVKDGSVKLRKTNQIKVDYRFTGDLQNIREELENRRISFDKIGEIRKPVTLNLTMNNDGYGHHRILTKFQLEGKKSVNLPPAWKSYDPQAGSNHLEQFRKELLTCYDEFDPRKYKNRRNKFIADLTALAIVGSKLYASAFNDLNCPDGMDPWDWEEKFREITSKATVIQVSRTGPASYVFPWAMVYEFPLEEDMPETYRSCKSLWEEWDTNAIRTKEAGTQCPHLNEHIEDLRKAKQTGKSLGIICPYAFWGYKHIIEQPLSVVDRLTSAPDCVNGDGEFTLSIGITHDIDAGEYHLEALRALMPNAKLNPPDPADDRDKVQQMLKAPKIVYFLCHGDKENGQTYINVGMHDTSRNHKITANTLEQWKRSSVDKASWQKTHPLVFINGCGTADLRPGLAFSLVSAFANMDAGGVIGTEVSIKTDTAYPAGEFILDRMSKGTSLGRAIREMRWELLNKGDLLGLAYTPYGLADLHVT